MEETKLPKGWVITKLETVVKYKKGKKPKKLEDYEFEGSVPYLDIKAFEKSEIRRYADPESSNLIEIEDIGIVWDGARSGWVSKNKAGAVGSTIAILKPLLLNSDYLYHFLQSQFNYLNSNTRGTGIPHVDPKVLWGINLPLPPRPEQDRIVAKVDALMAQVTVMQESLVRIPQLLKDFRQQVLTQAVTGKLTEEWREGKLEGSLENVIKNLQKLRAKDNKTSMLKKLKEIYSDEKSSINFLIPDTWFEVNLDKICYSFSYGTSTKSDNVGTYPVLRMGNMQNGKLDWGNLKYTSDKKEFEKYKLKKGDVLFNRTNSPELVGKTSIFNEDREALYAGYLIKIKSSEALESKYLNYSLNSHYGRKWCWSVKTDGVSQSNINAAKLSKFTIPLPPIKEQQEIVRRVESLFSKADAIQQQYETLKQKIDSLPQAILHKTFKGELVEQLPSDSYAAELLREIEEMRDDVVRKKK